MSDAQIYCLVCLPCILGHGFLLWRGMATANPSCIISAGFLGGSILTALAALLGAPGWLLIFILLSASVSLILILRPYVHNYVDKRAAKLEQIQKEKGDGRG